MDAPRDSQSVSLDDCDFGPTLRGHHPGNKVFKRFTLDKLLGRGGMGIVWLAHDDLLDRQVAIKFAPDLVLAVEEAIEDLKNETRRGLDLAHPNIVKIYDFLQDSEHAAIAMEYVDGETLSHMRVRQPKKVFEPYQVERWVTQLLDGLSYAHRGAKIVHRDLKPPNLIISQQGDLKIMDFGIARTIQDTIMRATVSQLGSSTGTVAYMSPQQMQGKIPSVADDLYALGSTLYEMFTGKPPFWTGDLREQLRGIVPPTVTQRRQEFGLAGSMPFPENWEEAIRRCLSKEAENRPADVEEVRKLLGLPGAAPAALGAAAFQMPTSPPGIDGTGARTPTMRQSGSARVLTTLPPAARVTVQSTGGMLSPETGLAHARATQQSAARAKAASVVYTDEPAKSGAGIGIWIALSAAVIVAGGGYWWWQQRPPAGGDPVKPVVITTPPTLKPNVPVVPPVLPPAVVIPPPVTPPPVKPPEPPVVVTVKDPPPVVPPVTVTDPPPTVPVVVKSATVTPVVQPPPQPPAPVKTSGAELLVPGTFATIQAAFTTARQGDTVIIAAGLYEEALVLPLGVSLLAQTAGTVTVMADGQFSSALRVEAQTQPVKVKGIIFSHKRAESATDSAKPAVQVLASAVTFEDCGFESSLADGVVVSGSSQEAQFIRCTAQRNFGDGFLAERGGQVKLESCTAEGNRRAGLRLADRTTYGEVTGGTFQKNLTSFLVETGAGLKGAGLRCVNNKQNGLFANHESSVIELDNCVFTHNGFVDEGGAGASRRTGGGGFGILGDKAVFKLNRLILEDNAERGINLNPVGPGTEILSCQLRKNPKVGIALVGSEGVAGVVLEENVCEGGGIGIAVIGQGFKPRLVKNRCVANTISCIVVKERAEPVLESNVLENSSGRQIDRAEAGPGMLEK